MEIAVQLQSTGVIVSHRVEIFKCRVGSHLYGTNLPDSDEDFSSIFLPSVEDLCGLNGCPDSIKKGKKISEGAKNHKGDIDDKALSFRCFLNLLAKGDIVATEMLFAPAIHEHYIFKHWIRPRLLEFVVSKKFVKSLLGMATSPSISPKDMSHKYRAAWEALELLIHQRLTFPRPDYQRSQMIAIKQAERAEEYVSALRNLVFRADGLYMTSTLRSRPDLEELEKICLTILKNHVTIGYKEDDAV